LGSCYAVGKGVDKDQVRAYFWLTLASKQHDKDAEKQRSELAPQLSPDDITRPSCPRRRGSRSQRRCRSRPPCTKTSHHWSGATRRPNIRRRALFGRKPLPILVDIVPRPLP
jgi:TPR repeat protein